MCVCVCVCDYRAVPREDHLLPAVRRQPLHHRRPQLGGENWLQVRRSTSWRKITFVSKYSGAAVYNLLHAVLIYCSSKNCSLHRIVWAHRHSADSVFFFSFSFSVTITALIKTYVVFSLRYYNWSTAAPLMLAMQAFQKPLPKVRNWFSEQTLKLWAGCVTWILLPLLAEYGTASYVFASLNPLYFFPSLHSLWCIILQTINLQSKCSLIGTSVLIAQVKLCLPFCSPPPYFITPSIH